MRKADRRPDTGGGGQGAPTDSSLEPGAWREAGFESPDAFRRAQDAFWTVIALGTFVLVVLGSIMFLATLAR